MRASIEVADIFRAAGPTYRADHAGHLSLQQLKVMSAIEHCRTAALGGHVEACEDCGHWRVAYNSCRNRHCPKCQGAAARTWLAEREADLLPVGQFEKPPHRGRFVIHLCGDLREAGDAGTGRVLGH